MALAIAFVSACGACGSRGNDGPSPPGTVDRSSARPSAVARSTPRIPGGPRASYDPIDVALTGTLPRSADFLGIGFTIDAARVTNTHPYTLFGEPRPGAQLFAVLDVTAENLTKAATDYGFNAKTFSLRTFSGQLLPTIAAPGAYDFSRLAPGDRKQDELVFGAYDVDVLDGAALMIGRPPDAPTIVPLTAPQNAAAYPIGVSAATTDAAQVGPIAWSVLGGRASLDRPAGVCCPKTGTRADDGELFLSLDLRGLVHGSKYGQASITTDGVRIVVDGMALKALGSKGKANVPEGATYEFAATWLIPSSWSDVALEVGAGTPDARRIPLVIGDVTPVPSAAPAA